MLIHLLEVRSQVYGAVHRFAPSDLSFDEEFSGGDLQSVEISEMSALITTTRKSIGTSISGLFVCYCRRKPS